MKFVISSTELLGHLQSINKVISPKNTLPILDNFLFNLKNKELIITASDLETTMITRIPVENSQDDGLIAIPARLLSETLKQFPEQPLTFDVDAESRTIVIHSENGQFTIVGQNGSEFPQLPTVSKESKSTLTLACDILNKGIARTIFATSDDELRPVMNGIFFEIGTENLTFVASDAQKLVKYQHNGVKAEKEASFVLPKKPANLLKGILPREEGDAIIEFDEKNALFTLPGYTMVCRLAEGQFPSYNAVIPTENPNKMTIDKDGFINALRRVSLFSNQASNLIKLQLKSNEITVSAQDIDFSISAYERLKCRYEGEAIEIGFKSTFLIEILSNLSSEDVLMEMSNPSRAGILKPVIKEDENEDILMLIMPMMINA